MRKVSIGLLVFALTVSLLATHAAGANLTLTVGGGVSIELVFSEAAFRNTLSIVSPAVAIAASGCKLEPAIGLLGVQILSEKVSQRGCRVDLDADPATPGVQPFPMGTIFTFGFCAQTNPDPNCEFVWSSNPASNSDGFDHLRTTPLFPTQFPGRIFQLAWEDQQNGGDQDFNDLIAVLRVGIDSDGDGLWDDWEQFGIDTDADGTIDLNLPTLGANPLHKDIFLEIDYMDCAVAGGDCAAGDAHSHRPKTAAINAVVQAFANAPVTNPDNVMGIILHVDVAPSPFGIPAAQRASNAIPHQNFVSINCVTPGGNIGSFDTVKSNSANFGTANPRRFAFHYQLFTHRQGPATTSSGCSELPGNDTQVALGEWNSVCIGPGVNGILDTAAGGDDIAVLGNTHIMYTGPNLVCNTAATGDDVQIVPVGSSPLADRDGDGLDDRTVGTVQQQAGTLMHELGHNLRLCHGGQFDSPGFAQCNANYKPNYLSLMNYFFQFGIPPTDPDGAGPLTGRVDYSRTALPNLNENNLNENVGIQDGTDNTRYSCPNNSIRTGAGTGGIDWNCDGDTTDTGIAVNVNRADDDGISRFGMLNGFDDWANLVYAFQNTAAFEDGFHETPHVEVDYPTQLQIPDVVRIDIKPGSFPNVINLKSKGKIPVAILSSSSFDAPSLVDTSSLTFGRTGDETSLAFCNASPEDVNGDGRLDLVCHFETQKAGFQAGNTLGTLKGRTTDGGLIIGTDSVRVIK